MIRQNFEPHILLLGNSPGPDVAIDYYPTNGLSGVHGALAYEVEEIEYHFHNSERWFGLGAVEDSLTPYVVASGDGDWGSEVLILDTGDTPVLPGMVYYDPHEIFITAFSNNTPFYIQYVWGTGAFADSLAAGNKTTRPVMAPSVGAVRGAPMDIRCFRVQAGNKLWIRIKNATLDANLELFVGLHEYPGV